MSEPLRNKLVRAVAPFLDGMIVFAMIVGVWAVLVRSPICNPSEPQWARERYLVAAGMAAGAYVLLTAAAGLYRAHCRVARARIPLANVGTWALLFVMSWVGLARYAEWTEGTILLSRRVLLFGMAGAYLLTTIHHYARLGLTGAREHHREERS